MLFNPMIKQIYQTGAVIFADHALTNGKILPVYIDLRQSLAFPDIYQHIVDAMWLKIEKLKFDVICGLPYGAIPLAAMISAKYHVPLVLLRKEAKNHGTGKILDGKAQAGDKVLLLDDFISSGNTMCSAIELLTEHGLQVMDVAVFIDSILGGSERVRAKNINVHSVMSLAHFYKELRASVVLSASEEQRIAALSMVSAK